MTLELMSKLHQLRRNNRDWLLTLLTAGVDAHDIRLRSTPGSGHFLISDEPLEGLTLLNRLPTLAEVADTAAFLASDRAGAITGTVANLTCGSSVD